MSYVRNELWDLLRNVRPQTNCPWLVAGDFNAMLSQNDKRGGGRLSLSATRDFNNCLLDCDLLVLEVRGPYFT